MLAPEPAVCYPARVFRVIDGDTVEVWLKLLADVRLLDCWAPERGTIEGEAARSYLKTYLEGEDVLLWVPIHDTLELSKLFTFGRVLGRIFVEGRDVSEQMVAVGHATEKRKRKRKR